MHYVLRPTEGNCGGGQLDDQYSSTIRAPHKRRAMYNHSDYTRRLDFVAAPPHTYFLGLDGEGSACPVMPRQDVT